MKFKIARRASKRKNERGNVVAYTVLSTLFLFLAVGLGVDLSRLYLVKAELQNASDAGALAGGYALGEIATSPSSRITTAVDRAITVMNQNKWGFDNKTFVSVMSLANQRSLVTLAKNLNGTYISEAAAQALSDPEKLKLRFIKVYTPQVPVTSIFALPILGTKNLDANSTAGMSVPGNVRFCPAPIAAVAPDPNSTFPTEFESHCPSGTLDPFDDDGDPDTPNCNPATNFCKKCWYRIKQAPQGQNGGGPSPGNFGYIQCGGPGANILEDNLASYGSTCRCGNISPNDNVQIVKTGQNTGPAETGLNTRFNIYANGQHPQYADAPPDTNVYGQDFLNQELTWTQYKAASPMLDPSTQTGGHIGQANRRVLVLPMVSYSNWPNGGSGPARVNGFGGFFLKKAVDGNNDIVAEFIGDEITSVVGYDPNGTNTTNVVTIVLYK